MSSRERLTHMSDAEVWALRVRESYNVQLEDGISEPRLSEHLKWTIPSGSAIDELGKLGLVSAVYADGVMIEPESKYPRRGEAQLIGVAGEVA